MDETQNQTDEAHAAPAKKGKGKLVIILAAVLAIGGGAGWWFTRGDSATAEAHESKLEERGLVAFEPFLVNLADAGGNRFLKVNIQLVVPSVELAEHIEKTPVILMHLRSSILELLTQQNAAALVTAEGKLALKEAIKLRVAADVPDQKVLDVLFSEFVVQF